MKALIGSLYHCGVCNDLLYTEISYTKEPVLRHEKRMHGECENVGKLYAVPTVELQELDHPQRDYIAEDMAKHAAAQQQSAE